MPQPPCPIREKLLAQPNTWQTVKGERRGGRTDELGEMNGIAELMEHDTLTCQYCLLLSMEEKRGGRELLFANGMPDWFSEFDEKKRKIVLMTESKQFLKMAKTILG